MDGTNFYRAQTLRPLIREILVFLLRVSERDDMAFRVPSAERGNPVFSLSQWSKEDPDHCFTPAEWKRVVHTMVLKSGHDIETMYEDCDRGLLPNFQDNDTTLKQLASARDEAVKRLLMRKAKRDDGMVPAFFHEAFLFGDNHTFSYATVEGPPGAQYDLDDYPLPDLSTSYSGWLGIDREGKGFHLEILFGPWQAASNLYRKAFAPLNMAFILLVDAITDARIVATQNTQPPLTPRRISPMASPDTTPDRRPTRVRSDEVSDANTPPLPRPGETAEDPIILEGQIPPSLKGRKTSTVERLTAAILRLKA